jgi:hypothetical protein
VSVSSIGTTNVICIILSVRTGLKSEQVLLNANPGPGKLGVY